MIADKNYIEFIFAGKDEITGQLGNISDGFGELNSKAAGLAKGIIALEAAMAGLVVAGITYAYNEAVKLDAALADLNKVLGKDTTITLEEAGEKATQMALKYGIASDEILQSIANWKQAGFTAAEAVELADKSIELMVAGEMSAVEATEILTSSLKGFDIGVSETTRLLDIINSVSAEYATNSKQLAIAMSDLSPIAKQMGFSLEETAGIVTPIIEVFRSGSEAANALKVGLLSISDDAKPVQDALKAIGVEQKDANGELRNGRDVLFDVMKAFGGLTDAQKTFFTAQLVGKEQSARMISVFDNLAKVTDITKAANERLYKSQDEVNMRLAISEYIIKRFQVSFGELSKRIGTEFRSAVDQILVGGTNIFTTLMAQVDAGKFDPVLARVRDFANRFGNELKAIAKALPEALEGLNFKQLFESLDGLENRFASIFDVDLTKPEGLRKAIQSVIDGATILNKAFLGIIDTLTPLFKAIADGVEWFSKLNKEERDNIIETAATTGKILGLVLAVEKLAGVAKLLPVGALTNPITAVGAAAVITGAAARKLFDELGGFDPDVDMYERIRYEFDETGNAASGLKYSVDEMNKKLKEKLKLELDKEAAEQAKKELKEFTDNYQKMTQDAFDKELKLKVDEKALTTAKNEFGEFAKFVESIIIGKDGKQYRKFTVRGEVDKPSIDKVKKTIDDLPDEQRIKIEAELEVAKIQAEAQKLESYLDFQAKIETAQLENDARKIESVFESLQSSFSVSTSYLTDLIGYMQDLGDSAAETSMRYSLEEKLNRENELREKRLKLEEDLIRAQLKLQEEKARRLASGDALIKVSMDGRFEPSLTQMAMEFVRYIQIAASAEGLENLIGA